MVHAQGPAGGREALAPRVAARLSPDEFADRLEAARSTLWYVAAAVLGERSEAEDAVQEAAMTALQKLDDFDPATNFPAWMSQIVRNVARNYLHKRTRRRTAPTDTRDLDESRTAAGAGEQAPLTARGDLVADQDVFDDELSQALGELEETPRICLLLRTLANLSYHEVSRILGIPEGTAMSHVHRSRTALRARLGERGARGGVA